MNQQKQEQYVSALLKKRANGKLSYIPPFLQAIDIPEGYGLMLVQSNVRPKPGTPAVEENEEENEELEFG